MAKPLLARGAESVTRAGWLPSPAQARLLRAYATRDDSWVTHWAAWRSTHNGEPIDALSQKLLPLIYWKARVNAAADPVMDVARTRYLATYARNQRRMATLADVLDRFTDAAVPTVLLKGIALNAAWYPSHGLRDMGDIDLLVPVHLVRRAADVLQQSSWHSERGLDADRIAARVTRVRHAWSFTRGPEDSLDLHWRPGSFCFWPGLVDEVWRASRAVSVQHRPARLLCATDQLLHVCAHGVQLSAAPSIRWIADATTILHADHVDWHRFTTLARRARLTTRLHDAVDVLIEQVGAPIPAEVRAELAGVAPRWERYEWRFHARAAPRGRLDKLQWHWWHFNRLRAFDNHWSRAPALVAFVDYLRRRHIP
jgi:hypothetical protein